MQSPPSTSLSTGQIVLALVATSITSGLIGLLINRILNWASGRSRAEVVEIHARSVKLDTESQVSNAQMLLDALRRITELVEINSNLQDELNEASRQRDDCEFNYIREKRAHEQLRITSGLQEHFIRQLEAANKLGVQLADLPVEMKKATGTDDKAI